MIDVSKSSTAAGTMIGLYTWNRGTNQKLQIEGGAPAPGTVIQFEMVHSSLRLEAVGATVVQNPARPSSQAQNWELVDPTTASVGARKSPNLVKPRSGTGIDALGRNARIPSMIWLNWGF